MTRHLLNRLTCLLVASASLLLGACQFFGPSTNEQVLSTQNAALSTEIAAVRATATVDADRLLSTLEHAQTTEGHVGRQTDALSATLIALGTPAGSIDLSQITPDAPIADTFAGNTNVPPVIVLGGPTPGGIGVTPPADPVLAATQAASGAIAQTTPVNTNQQVASGGALLSNIVTTDTTGADDCATRTLTTFDSSATEIYVVATANGIGPSDTVTSSWMLEGTEVVSYDWNPSFDIAGACIWFYIDAADVTFTPGNWQVSLSVNGTPMGTPTQFSITGGAPGDALFDATPGT